ncbi:carbohydrate ABC transporter membrane protein 2, CUT1 family [Desulfacinum infernum DSM 9756]|uniref:Carbohydrate ABC transporter membrane protein 2, CUT1 family n=1 Tax=Desulfacinum infernum DSM 9756 TaxID=1121391 RepID=A0A1M4YAJ8_9BACT|nr:carbohydrate ABC transporter permease [Desulfacinum infernum]SHF02626.1 carbohydrate ABC transporter membrane protein 2, CUT1 family [Desulfacinum infernum DSM 9756]
MTSSGFWSKLETVAAWMLGILWAMPLLYAIWAAFHPPAYAVNFDLTAPVTLANFWEAWHTAPFARYFINTILYTTMTTALQFVLCTLAAYSFACYDWKGKDLVFSLILVQLMVMPDQLLVVNYQTMSALQLVDTIPAISLPYIASAFGVFLLRQNFKQVPLALAEAARIEGAGPLRILLKIYVPLSKSVYLAYGLVSISWHWNNFLWPLVITNSATTRPLTVGLAIFGSPENGVNFAVVSAGTLMSVAPLLIAFLLFQRQFVQSFMRAGIK